MTTTRTRLVQHRKRNSKPINLWIDLHNKQDKIRNAANHPTVKQLLNTKQVDEKLIGHLQETGKSKRATSGPSNYATFAGKTYRATKK